LGVRRQFVSQVPSESILSSSRILAWLPKQRLRQSGQEFLPFPRDTFTNDLHIARFLLPLFALKARFGLHRLLKATDQTLDFASQRISSLERNSSIRPKPSLHRKKINSNTSLSSTKVRFLDSSPASWSSSLGLMVTQSLDDYLVTGTVHGFAARPSMANATIKKAFIDALGQAAAWLSSTL
jgi:hypothetical protein